jgi:hypothetical protein
MGAVSRMDEVYGCVAARACKACVTSSNVPGVYSMLAIQSHQRLVAEDQCQKYVL